MAKYKKGAAVEIVRYGNRKASEGNDIVGKRGSIVWVSTGERTMYRVVLHPEEQEKYLPNANPIAREGDRLTGWLVFDEEIRVMAG